MNNLESRFVTKCPFCDSEFVLTINQIRHIKDKVSCSKCKRNYSLKDNLHPYVLSHEKPTLRDQNETLINSKETTIGFNQKSKKSLLQDKIKFNYDSFDVIDEFPRNNSNVNIKSNRKKKKVRTKSRLKNIIPDYLDLDNYIINKDQFNLLEDNFFLDDKDTSFLERFTLSYFLSFLSVLMILLQFVYYNFQSLKDDESWHFLLKPFCAINLCNLETPDINKIALNNIQTRLNKDGTWQVHALLFNLAKYKQPFPLLEMIFKDGKGKIVSNLYIHPGQYTNGEISGESFIPNNVSVHIAFKIQPPKGFIAGYQFILRHINEGN